MGCTYDQMKKEALEQGRVIGYSITLVEVVGKMEKLYHISREKACDNLKISLEDYENAKKFIASEDVQKIIKQCNVSVLSKTFSKDDTFQNIKTELVELQKNGHVVTMGTIVDKVKEQCREYGIETGRAQLVLYEYNLGYSMEKISVIFDLSLENVKDIVTKQELQ